MVKRLTKLVIIPKEILIARTFGSTKIEFNEQMLNEWKAFGKCGLKFATIAKLKCVDVTTISRYHKEHPELILAYDEGLSGCEKSLKSKAIELADAGNMDALKYVLKHIADWKDTNRIESEHTERKVILIKDSRAVTELEKLASS